MSRPLMPSASDSLSLTTQHHQFVSNFSNLACAILLLDRNLYSGGAKPKLWYSGERLQNVTAVTDAHIRFLATHRASISWRTTELSTDDRVQTIPSKTGR